MAHWLMKSEPDVFGWPHLVEKASRGQNEQWHGVRNFAARNNMMKMALGDEAFFYHSNVGKEIVGIMKVVALAHPDSTAEPNDKGKIVWQCVDVAPVRPFKRPVTLETIKTTPGLENMALIKYSRLSVQPVTDAEWQIVCGMGGL
jgi:predicted RNA-binding protein with PUA-like domain